MKHEHNDSHGADQHGAHSAVGTFKSYMLGFALAAILTGIAFALVMTKAIVDPKVLGFVILGLAAVQVVVHMVYFLHMNTRSEGGWTLLALVFTAVVLMIMLSGSIWVMYHLNTNMMPPMTMQEMRNAP